MTRLYDPDDALASFFDQGLIIDVLHTVASGKEAAVFCCRAGSALGVDLVAAKVYRPRQTRRFKNDSVYREGRVILDARSRRAVAKKTRQGAEASFVLWLDHERETLAHLYRLGASVPRPFAMSERALLMTYLGATHAPAPPLRAVDLADGEAPRLFDAIVRNVELWLANHVVHGDLSAFNILYWEEEVTIIDFPQAVDPRTNPHAFSLLERDLRQVCRYFQRYGMTHDPARLAADMWTRYVMATL